MRNKLSGILAGGGFGATALIGACGGACAATAFPLGGFLATVGLGSVAIFLVKLRIPLLIVSSFFAGSWVWTLIKRKQYKYATVVGISSGFIATFLLLQIFFPLGFLHQSSAPVTKTSLSEFKERFNRDSDKVRFVGLLSPGCDICQRAHREMIVPLFKDFGTETLQGYEVWLSWMYGDSLALSSVLAATLRDPRVAHLWDEEAELTKAFTKTLSAKLEVWDIYLVYPRGVKWDGDVPPKPAFFMHQLPEKYGLDPDLHLDKDRFISETSKYL